MNLDDVAFSAAFHKAKQLPDRLREHADRIAGGGPSESTYDPETLTLEHEAADEIERLLNVLRVVRDNCYREDHVADIVDDAIQGGLGAYQR